MQIKLTYLTVASDAILEGEELFRIPQNTILDNQSSALRKRIPEELDSLDPWLSLILVLVYESLLGDRSEWYPYIQLLPVQFDTPMFWTDAELAELQGSAIVGKIGKKEAEAGFIAQLVPIVKAHPELFPLDHENVADELVRLAHIAGSRVMAYAFDIEHDDLRDDESLVTDDEENPAKGMVPFADMLNADVEKNNVSSDPTDRSC